MLSIKAEQRKAEKRPRSSPKPDAKENRRLSNAKSKTKLKTEKALSSFAAGRTNWSAAVGDWRASILEALRDDGIGYAVVPASVGLVRIDPQFSAPIHWDFEWGIDTCIFDSFDIEQQAKQKELLRHQKKLTKKNLRFVNTDGLEALMGSYHLQHMNYTCLFSRANSKGQCGPNQKAHMDYKQQGYEYYKRYLAGQSSAPASTITAMSVEGLWLDIWWVSEHWVPAGKAKLKRKPTHPDDAPNVRIFLKYGDTLIFRHDLWHGGVGYDHDNYRLFCYFNSEDKEVEIDDDSEGETYPAECPCKNARRCTCKPRTSAAKEVLDEGKPKWVTVCFPAPPPR